MIKTSKEMLGQAHPDTLTSMANLSFTLRNLGRRQSSIDLLTLCATMSSDVLGPSQRRTIDRYKYVEDWKAERSKT